MAHAERIRPPTDFVPCPPRTGAARLDWFQNLDNAISLDTFNNPNAPPPRRGEPATVSFAREDLLVLDGAEAG